MNDKSNYIAITKNIKNTAKTTMEIIARIINIVKTYSIHKYMSIMHQSFLFV